MSYRTNPDARCPACLGRLDGAMPANGRGRQIPRVGDLSVCISCTVILEFNSDLTVRLASAETLASLDAETRRELERARAICRLVTR